MTVENVPSEHEALVEFATNIVQQRNDLMAQTERLRAALREIADMAYATQFDQSDPVVRFANRLFFIAERGLDGFRESIPSG